LFQKKRRLKRQLITIFGYMIKYRIKAKRKFFLSLTGLG